MKVVVTCSFQPTDVWQGHTYNAQWLTNFTVTNNFNHVGFTNINTPAKPTSRQLRRWKKQAKLCHG